MVIIPTINNVGFAKIVKSLSVGKLYQTNYLGSVSGLNVGL